MYDRSAWSKKSDPNQQGMTSVRRVKGVFCLSLLCQQPKCLDGRAGSAVGSTNRGRGGLSIPVGASGENVVASEVVAGETEVIGGQRAFRVDDGAEVAGDAAVEANVAVGGAAEVAAEETERGVELLEHHSLGLDFADLLGDNALGHLLEDQEALLNDHNGL